MCVKTAAGASTDMRYEPKQRLWKQGMGKDYPVLQVLLPYLAKDRRELIAGHDRHKQQTQATLVDILAKILVQSVEYRQDAQGVADVYWALHSVCPFELGDMLLRVIHLDVPWTQYIRDVLRSAETKIINRGHGHLFARYTARWIAPPDHTFTQTLLRRHLIVPGSCCGS